MSSEIKKPQGPRANAMPTDGFLLTVDNKMKTRYDTSEAAMTAANELKRRYPMIHAAVYDAAARTYTPVGLDETPAGKPEA